MASSPAPVRAAGTLLWRLGRDGTEFAIIRRERYDDWTLPKGKVDRNEHLLSAAVREVREETGHEVVLGRPLPTQRYTVAGAAKVVRYWAAEATDPVAFKPNDEVSELVWLHADEARHRLSYRHDARVLAGFLGGPLRTTPLVVLRHAKAVKRAAWSGIDAERPLDRRGHAEAKRLVALLSTFGVDSVLSSPAARCLQTVQPFADQRSLEIAEEALLSETGHSESPGKSRRRAATLLRESAALVVCSHRPALPDLIGALLGAGQPLPRQLRPGGFLVLHRDLDHKRPVIVAIERHRP